MYIVERMLPAISRTAVLICIVFLFGCGGGLRIGNTLKYVNPNVNFSYIKKVAILPFNNMSRDKYAGEKVRSTLTIDLMGRHVFEVLEKGEVTKVLTLVFRAAGIEAGSVTAVDKETLKLLGERLGVQAVILGNVFEYESSRKRAIVSVTVRMLDASSGIILWTARADASGTSFWRKLVGLDSLDTTQMTKVAVKRVLDTLL